jgi:hypothetical protein
MPATGRLRGTPASISASEVPQTVAIEDDPFDSVISETTRMVYGNFSFDGSSGCTARQASFPCPTSPSLTYGIGREIVMQHEMFAVLAQKGIHDLLILPRAKGCHAERLGFPTREQSRPVCPG